MAPANMCRPATFPAHGLKAGDSATSDFDLAVQRSLEEHQELRQARKRVRKAIQRQLPQDMYVKPVLPDGNGLFHALSADLAAGFALQRSHRALRLECAQAIPVPL